MGWALGLRSGCPWEQWLSLCPCPLRWCFLWTSLGGLMSVLGSVWSEAEDYVWYQFGPHWLLRRRSSRDRFLRPLSIQGECGMLPRGTIGGEEEGEVCRLGGIGEGASLTFTWLGEQLGVSGHGSEPFLWGNPLLMDIGSILCLARPSHLQPGTSSGWQTMRMARPVPGWGGGETGAIKPQSCSLCRGD